LINWDFQFNTIGGFSALPFLNSSPQER